MDFPSIAILEEVPEMIQTLGSISSMLGLAISLYVLWREVAIQKDVTALKQEEESWHENCPRRG